LLNQLLTYSRRLSDSASEGLSGSSMITTSPPRPVSVPSMDVARRKPCAVVTTSDSVVIRSLTMQCAPGYQLAVAEGSDSFCVQPEATAATRYRQVVSSVCEPPSGRWTYASCRLSAHHRHRARADGVVSLRNDRDHGRPWRAYHRLRRTVPERTGHRRAGCH
jgi:hypothetical protein